MLSLTLPNEVSGPAVASMVQEIFQAGGTQAAADVLAALRVREDVPIERRRVISYYIGQKMRNAGSIGSNTTRTLDWAAGNLGASSLVGPGLLNELLNDAASRDPATATQWMDAHGASLAQDQAEAGFRALGSIMQSRSQNDLAKWLAKNPAHPYRDHVLSAAAGSALRAGEITQSEKLNSAIKDPKMHVKLEKAP